MTGAARPDPRVGRRLVEAAGAGVVTGPTMPARPDRRRSLPSVGWRSARLHRPGQALFFQGEDTGYASYRTVVVSRWPTVGPPPDFASAAEYDRTVATLIGSGVTSDPGMIYFDARLSARYPTVEIRIADACPSVDDAVLIAALARALVITAARADTATDDRQPDATVPQSPQVLARAATWRAARSGLVCASGHPGAVPRRPLRRRLELLRRPSPPARSRHAATVTNFRLIRIHRRDAGGA